VIVNVESEELQTSPAIILDQIIAGGIADLFINAPYALMYQGYANLDDMINVSTPGKRDNLVLLPGADEELIIYDLQGNETVYKLRPNGMLKINEAITIKGSNYYVGDSEITSGSGSTQVIAHYYLPGGDLVAVDRNTGRIVNVIAFNGKIYDLDAIEFVDNGDQKIIRFKQENFNVIYTYDTGGQLIDVKIEINEENLENGGVTIYVETEPSELGWTLPDGTRVYYKNAFLQNGQEIEPIFLGMKGGNYLYLLEPLHADREFYHVVEFQMIDGGNVFVEAHTIPKISS
jgi:hypothetical protein